MGNTNEDNTNKAAGGDKVSKPLAELRAQRGIVQGQQTKMKNIIMTRADFMDVSELETRLSLIEGYLSNFNRIQSEIERLDPEDSASERREAFEETYIEIKSKILQVMNNKRPRNSLALFDGSITGTAKGKVKSLPKLKLTKFTGRYSEWPDFISMFTNLVHNDEDLSDIDKLQHLKSCLEDAALLPISSLEIVGENYETALGLLKKRFENKRLIFQEHVTEVLNLKPVERNSLHQLRSLSDSVNAHFRALLSLGNKEQIADALLIHIIHNKLDFGTQAKWEDEAPQDKLPTWEELAAVIEKRCIALENLDQSRKYSITRTKPSTHNNNTNNKGHKWQSRGSTFVAANARTFCTFCNRNEHFIQGCPDFNALSPMSRYDEAKRLKLCLNCLKGGHSVKHCKSSRCRSCTFKHHTLLHMGSPTSQTPDCQIGKASASGENSSHFDKHDATTSSQNKSSLTSIASPESSCQTQLSKGHVLLATALIEVMGSNGVFVPCRALLDSASQLNFITERLAQLLRLKKTKINIALNGIGNTNTTVRNVANVTVRSRVNDFATSFDAYILHEITGNQPDSLVIVDDWNIPQNIIHSLTLPYQFLLSLVGHRAST